MPVMVKQIERDKHPREEESFGREEVLVEADFGVSRLHL